MTDQTTTTAPGATDPAARLEALGTMTQETEAANPSHEQQAEAAAELAAKSEAEIAAQQWGMLMYTVGGFACMIAPELKPVYTQERCFDWGLQVNAVADKYGWNGPSVMPEIALFASTVGFVVPTVLLVRQKVIEAKEGKGPASWLNKIGLWWRTRKARANVMTPEAPAATAAAAGAGDGVKQ